MNIRKFFSDIGISSIRYGVTLVRGIIIIPILTNSLGVGNYGIWATITGVTGILATLGTLNLSDSLVRYVPSAEKSEQVLVDTLSMQLLIGLVLAVCYISIGTYVPELLGDPNHGIIVTSGIYIFTSGSLQICQGYLRSLNKIKIFELVTIIRTVLETVGLVVVFVYFRSLVAGFVVLIIVSIVVGLTIILYYIPLRSTYPAVSNFKTYLKFSVPVVPQTLSSRLIRDGDRYLILVLIGPDAAGIYSVASTVGNMLEELGKMINPTLYPTVVREWESRNMETLTQIYNLILRWFTLLGVPAFIGILLLSTDILTLLSTQKVAIEGKSILVVLAVGYIISSFNSPLLFLYFAADRTHQLTRTYLIAVVLNLVLNIILIQMYGIMGAAIATVATYVYITWDIYRLTSRLLDYNLSKNSMIYSLLGSGIMAGVLILLPLPQVAILRLIVLPFVGVLVYFSALYVSGAFTKNELNYIKDAVETLS